MLCSMIQTGNSKSSHFSAEPPCYAKPVVPVVQAVATTSPLTEEQRWREEEIVRESKRLEEERLKREQEREKKEKQLLAFAEAESKRIAIEEQKARNMRLQLTKKVQDYLSSYYSSIREDIRVDLMNQSKLQSGRKVIDEQKQTLAETKVTLQSELSELNQQISGISEVIQQHAAKNKERKEPDVDEIALPTDARSRQILDLVVTDASLTDCLFFVDKGLYKGKLTLSDHLKQVRKLSKQQFMVRAHLMKIIQINNSVQS
jgi:ESCRT-I complex subunit TSG101